MKTAVYDIEGKKTADIDLSEAVFNVPANDALLHQAYVAIAGNQRTVIAHAKDRGERAGSGKKPWRQKGTGRARAGSVRSPIWRKGGVTFGPTKERNFKKNVTKAMNQKAIKVALSEKVRSGSLYIIDSFSFPEKKTKHIASFIKKLNLSGSALFGFDAAEHEWSRASRNIAKCLALPAAGLNVHDLLDYRNLVISADSVKYLEKKYAAKAKK